MNPFSLLIKPASADCNLRCEYCFYLEKSALYPTTPCHRMDDATLTHLIRSYLALPFPAHTFAFQGGEPLLMGEAFYRKVVQLQKRYARNPDAVLNCVQTNGTLLTPTLAEFFAQEHFLLGVSVDGPEGIHNLRRQNVHGTGSYADVRRGLNLLDAAHVDYNILTLVSQSNVRHPLEVYHHLRDELNCRHLQFIECIEPNRPYSITADEWADFMIAIFDEWFTNDRQRVSIRLFDSIVNKILTGHAHSCAMGCDCRAYFVVEHNGDIYPCDFFVSEDLKLGNLLTHDWDELWDNPLHTAFGLRKSQFHPDCKRCPYLYFCQGDCPKNRHGHTFNPAETVPSVLCHGWQRLYAHILPKLEAIAKTLTPHA